MWFLTHAWLVPALPALSFLLILFLGKRVFGPARAHWIGIPFVAAAFVLAVLTAGAWINRADTPAESQSAALSGVSPECAELGAAAASDPEAVNQVAEAEGGGEEEFSQPVVRCTSWLSTGNLHITIGTLVDGQSVLLLVVVTLVSLLVHIFSSDYVNGDRRYTHYFAFLSLFTASMLFFVLAENTLQMIVGWELVGVCSFVLIGHWWEEKPNSDAALKAFLTNRVGDIGLLVGVSLLFWQAGQTFSILDINTAANAGVIGHTYLLVASCCLLAAVMSKSGQFILHTWLPDAMAGPTPVSALIHAATMVVAGIYMVARLYPVFWEGFSIGGSSVNPLAVVGTVTALFGALLAFVQKDIKKVLAYSTVSQLGFMVAALGVGAWTAALFHLFTHAFFKACLFLGAGSLSHACHHSFNMVDDMGGLRKVMPRTFWTFVIGTASLVGIFPLAGFWSKDEILAGTGGLNTANGSYSFALIIMVLAAFCTAAYMTRAIWYAFYGEYRGHGEPHESGARITVPLMILAFLGSIAGFANIPSQMGGVNLHGLAHGFEFLVEPVGIYFPGGPQGFTHAGFNGYVALIATAAGLAGVGLVYAFYWKRSLKPLEQLSETNAVAGWFKRLLENKYYFDYLYTDVIVAAIKGPVARAAYWFNQHVIDEVLNGAGREAVRAGRFVYDRIDQQIVDGAVNGTGAIATEAGGGLRKMQTGRIQQYAALFFAAAALLAGVFVVAIG